MAVRLGLVVGVLAAVGSLPGCCSARIRGVVRDQETGAPITGATVQSGEARATTDNLGFYDLRDLDCDEGWRVVVQAPGYHMLSTSVLAGQHEDPARLMRDFPLAAIPRPPEPTTPASDAPAIEDYTPRHAALPGSLPRTRQVSAPALVAAPTERDKHLYIKLTEEQTRAVLEHMESHGPGEFTKALRRLIDALPKK